MLPSPRGQKKTEKLLPINIDPAISLTATIKSHVNLLFCGLKCYINVKNFLRKEKETEMQGADLLYTTPRGCCILLKPVAPSARL